MDFLPYKESCLYQILIPAYKLYSKTEQFVLYLIDVNTYGSSGSWRIEKRYSQIYELNETFTMLFANLPALPPKSIFALTEHDDIEQRRMLLQSYFEQIAKRSEIINSEPFIEFFQVFKFNPVLMVTPPKLQFQITTFVQSVRDFQLSQDSSNLFLYHGEGQLFVATGQFRYLQRVDAFLSNWNNQITIPLGGVELWKFKQGGQMEKEWTKDYIVQAICIFWEYISCKLLVGLDNGHLDVMSLPEQFESSRITESETLELHSSRITGVHYDKNQDLIYSVSKDGYFNVFHLSKKVFVKQLNMMDELSSFTVSQERKICAIGGTQGFIYVFDISQIEPELIYQCQTKAQHTLRNISLDSIKGYLFALGYQVSKGSISVVDLGKIGKERFGKQTASLKSKSQSREICWSSKRKEVYVGHSDGTITVWKILDAQPIYVIQAHAGFITKLKWIEQEEILISASNENQMKFWKLPESWQDGKQRLEEQKEQEIRMSHLKQQKEKLSMDEQEFQYDSDGANDLNDWHK